jgi:hypothetical protein
MLLILAGEEPGTSDNEQSVNLASQYGFASGQYRVV